MELSRLILLVEDNPGDARLISDALSKHHPMPQAMLVHVSRLSDGLARVNGQPFDAVLLDLSLPDAHGVEAVLRLRRQAETMPIVVLTGWDDDGAAVAALRAGAQEYLVKGQFDGRQLLRAVSTAIERTRLQVARQQDFAQMAALREIDAALTTTLNLPAVLHALIEKVAALLPDCAMSVRLWSQEHGGLVPAATHKHDDGEWDETEIAGRADRPARFSDAVFESKRVLMIPNAAHDARVHNREWWRRRGYTAYLGLPLLVGDEILGVWSFYSNQESEFASGRIDFLGALASRAAVAIRHCQIHGAIRQQASDLRRSNDVKEEFLGVLSHELRTPLNVVKGYAEMLQTGFFGEMTRQQGEAIEKIANQTRVQLAMINNILNATTMESEVATVQSEIFSLGEFLRDFAAAFPDRADGKLKFHWCYSPLLPELRTDRTKLQYILQNLINNAVKFTPEGAVTVAAEVRLSDRRAIPRAPVEPAKSWLTLRVADTGIGIAAENLSVIFEKFCQVDGATARAHEGIGLGLHIVKRCTELLNGRVKVESEIGKGTTFTVVIPCEVVTTGARADNVESVFDAALGLQS